MVIVLAVLKDLYLVQAFLFSSECTIRLVWATLLIL